MQLPRSPSPADGGWGWVIVASVFAVTFLSFGAMFSIGIIFDILVEELGCTMSEVSTAAGIAYSLQCFLGPVVGLLQQRFQAKAITVVGCLFTSVSFVTSAFVPNVEWFYFTFGVIGGIGMALAYLPMIVLISFYFTRRLGLATALGGIGSFAGSFCHPYIIRLLVDIYGWRGALIIFGAVVAHALPFSLLLRSKSAFEKEAKVTTIDLGKDPQPSGNDTASPNTPSTLESCDNMGELKQRGCIDQDEPSTSKQTTTTHNQQLLHDKVAPALWMKRRLNHKSVPGLCVKERREPPCCPRGYSSNEDMFARLSIASTSNIFSIRSSPMISEMLSLSNANKKPQQPSSTDVAEKEDQQGVKPPQPSVAATASKRRRAGGRFFAPLYQHFRNPKYSAFVVTNFLICLTFYAPSMFIVDWGSQLGIPPERNTLLLSLVGIGNIVGRPLMALFGDLLANYRIFLFASMVALCGICSMATYFLHDFYFLTFFVIQFAFFIGGSQTLLTPILSDMFPLSELAFAFGVLIAIEGIAILIGPALLAMLPSYALTFSAAGLLMVTASVILIAVNYGGLLICQCCLLKSRTHSV